MEIYNYNGNRLNLQETFNPNVCISYNFDETSSTNYTVFRINKKRIDGNVQYPFVRYKNPMITGLNLIATEGWTFVINGGVGTGLIIENSVVISDDSYATDSELLIPLSVNEDGNLGYLDADFIGKGQQYVSNGVVSAICGFFPIINNYEDFAYPTFPAIETQAWMYAQRQVIGQFGNGDYMVLTSEGRSFDNSVGLTMTDVQRICKDIGVKFAYNLDGGGSVQTIFGKRKTNMLYEGTSGRARGTFIVFNGDDSFAVPSVI